MKAISNELKSHIEQEVTCLCSCWRIDRKDGVSLYLTDLDRDLEIEGNLYRSSEGYNRDVLKGNNGTSTDEMEISGVLSSEWISEKDLQSGKYDHAEVYFFLVNWSAPSMGILPLRRGWIGEVSWRDNQFMAELRGLTHVLKREQSRFYMAECDADFCDVKCGLEKAEFQWLDEVVEVSGQGDLILKDFAETDVNLLGGLITFTSGANVSRSMEISNWDQMTKTAKMFLAFPEPIEVGDQVKLTAGCDKSFATCRDTYNNQINFRGFPDIPGTDRLLGGR
ncbi:DUF2163 domain-containing protein [Sneathiella sp. P13V-1]|uniref:DUF2163 domain-containing protein n=1 Tax=Sneathiella sp. P13V-1 TaxID=2697366 RepID=UPI00187B1903|nr:DUF2163 domain-containing protein [Sneathiella sp. P13V-1]MBE7637065.1 DUF2163 domain-containing protein [Sneathiella sp. P13V-1]